MPLTYISPRKPWHIDPTQLRHPYYVQTAPDNQHVVLGMLQQGTRPRTGRWLQLGTIDQPLAHRYFVQQTKFNTLVPGSLVQSEDVPGENWKEILTLPLYHVIGIDDISYTIPSHVGEDAFVTGAEFMEDVITPSLDAVYPDRNPAEPIRFRLYYYMDVYSEFDSNTDTLTPFSTGDNDTGLGYHIDDPGTYVNEISSTDTEDAHLIIQTAAPYGWYSVILAILNGDDEITSYIFINSVINHYLPA